MLTSAVADEPTAIASLYSIADPTRFGRILGHSGAKRMIVYGRPQPPDCTGVPARRTKFSARFFHSKASSFVERYNIADRDQEDHQ